MFTLTFNPSILTEENDLEIRDICTQYWKMEENKFTNKITDICKEHNLKQQDLIKLVKQYSSFVSDEHICKYCQKPISFAIRSDISTGNSIHYIPKNKALECAHPECEEIERNRLEVERQRIEQERKITIFDTVKETRLARGLVNVDVANTKIIDLIYLYVLLSYFTDESMEMVTPLVGRDISFFPTEEKTIEVILYLLDKKYLSVSEKTDVSRLTLNADKIINFTILGVSYSVNFEDQLNTYSNISSRIRGLAEEVSSGVVSDGVLQEITDLYDEVFIGECLAYLHKQTSDYKINFSAGSKTKEIFKQLAHKYTLGQIHCLTWMASKDTAAALHVKQYDSYKITNNLPNAIKNKADYMESQYKEVGESKNAKHSEIYKQLNKLLKDRV